MRAMRERRAERAMSDELHDMTLAAQSRALAAGEVSAVELAGHHLARIEASNGTLNALLAVDGERALEAARAADARRSGASDAPPAGPLTGVPIVHKDIFCTTDLPTTCGSRMLDGYRSPFDATVVARLRAAGTVLLGKANMDEFAMGSSNENSHYGAVANPWDTGRVPGGSSGGSAAAVAARLVPAATGTDTGGSVRQPAAFCGLTGLKPTYGRVSRYGMIAFASSLDQGGPLARTAEDCALLLRAMAGHDPRDATSSAREVPDYAAAMTLVADGLSPGDGSAGDAPLAGLRVGVPAEFFSAGLDAGVGEAVRAALAVLETQGATLVEVSLPNQSHGIGAYYVVAPAEASSNLSRFDGVRFGHRCENPASLEDLYERSRTEGFGAEVKRRILIGTYALSAGYYDAYYRKAMQVRRLISEDFERAFAEVDLIAGPTTPTTAFARGAKTDDPVAMYLNDLYTVSANLCGLPALSLPCGLSGGLPVGFQLIGRAFDEARLLGVAQRYQCVTDWHEPRAAVAARVGRGGRSGRDGGLANRGQAMVAGGQLMAWETVIGLEIHAQLATRSKIFSGSSTAFGAAPNTQASAVDLGLPGVLPVPNVGAVRMAVAFALATGASINATSAFARKNYFYPDLPKGYQISQMSLPIVGAGTLDVPLEGGGEKRVGLTRAHLEEDAGKSVHDLFPGATGIDLNRAGTPLLEIVSEPDMRSAAEAVRLRPPPCTPWCAGSASATATCRRAPFRCDANVSVRESGTTALGTRTEVKNVNSFRFLERAIEFEVERQIDVLESGGRVVQETRLYDPERDETRAMRTKEEANDYRYFPDPDLPPLVIDDALVRVGTRLAAGAAGRPPRAPDRTPRHERERGGVR